MKLIDLLGPMDPKVAVDISIDVEKDKYSFGTSSLYGGAAGTVPALLTKLKVTHISVILEEENDDVKPIIDVYGIFTTEDDANQYKTLIE